MRISPNLPRTVMLLASFGLAGLFAARLSGATPVFQWSTVAGRASAGSEDGAADKARFYAPQGLALDAAGNLYVTDKFNYTIRKITSAGVVSTVAGLAGQSGSVDGVGATARFNAPEGIAVDSSGNLYVADTGNHTIRKISSAGLVTTIAGIAGTPGTTDGPATTALFASPRQLAVDGAGKVYVLGGAGIRQIAGGQVQTVYQAGGTITLPDYSNNAVTATIGMGGGLAVDASGQIYFTAALGVYYSAVNTYSSIAAILKRDLQGGISLVYGGPRQFVGSEMFFRQLAIDGAGNLAVLGQAWWEGTRYPVYLVDSAGTIRISASIHDASGADIEGHGVALTATGDILYSRNDNAIFRLTATGAATLLAGLPGDAAVFPGAWSIAVDASGNSWIAQEEYKTMFGRPSDSVSLKKVTADGVVTTVIAPEFRYEVYGNSMPLVAADGPRGVCFLHGLYTQSTLTRVTPEGGVTDVFTGLKPNGSANVSFYALGFAVDPSGNPVVPDSYGHAIWRRSAEGVWTILAGKDGETGSTDGTGTDARFNSFQTITTDRSGNFYLLDATPAADGTPATSVIRRITPAGVVTTVSGNLVQAAPAGGASAVQPIGLAVDSKGAFYLAYAGLNSVWRLEPGGTPAPVGGVVGSRGDNDGLGTVAHFYGPAGIAVDAQDRLLVLDAAAGALRRGVPLFGPGITAQPQSASVAVGGSIQFSVTATGTPEPTYQWNFNGAAIPGAIGSTYTLGTVQPVNAGGYSVTVTNSVASATSNTAVLTIAGGSGNSGGGGSSGGGGGGGGAPGIWFYGALGAIAIVRFATRLGARHTRCH